MPCAVTRLGRPLGHPDPRLWVRSVLLLVATLVLDTSWSRSSPALPAGVLVAVGASLQAAVDASPAGTSFVLASGVHRVQSVRPKDGNVFTGQPGAVLNGARLVTAFGVEGSGWFADGQTQEGYAQGECRSATPLCNRPEDVFVDGSLLLRVTSRAALVPGSYFFDLAANRIWFGSDPRGRTVEASVAGQAFAGPARDVVVRSLMVEKYATPSQKGAVDASDGLRWTIDGVIAQRNHGGGLRAGNGTRILNSKALDNGQIGITGVGADIVVQGCEIARNNTAGYEPGWEAGGTKFALTSNLIVRGCSIHHNSGHGLWTDIDNIGTLFENNDVSDNQGEGIFHEISYAAVIRNNVVRRNGGSSAPWVWGAGIHIASSRDVQIYGNVVENNINGIVGSQQNRGTGAYGARELRNLDVHDNTVHASGKVGIGQDVNDQSIFTSRNNRFHANTYNANQLYTWMDRDITSTTWRSYGQDV